MFGGYTFTIPRIEYSLDTSAAYCRDIKYLCASFNKGDSAEPDHMTPFNVYGVEAEFDATVNPDKLIKCTPFTLCYGK